VVTIDVDDRLGYYKAATLNASAGHKTQWGRSSL